MKMTSRFALVAAAGLLMAVAPAKAADLGGGCCADLEERVAELEATTARKGNRVVSLQVYGDVNQGLLFFDDGETSDTYVVSTGDATLGFQGTAAIKPGLTAGYKIEFDIQNTALGDVTADNDDGLGAELDIIIDRKELWFESETLGRFSIGRAQTATDGIAQITLGNQLFVNGDELTSFSFTGAGEGVGLSVGDVFVSLDGTDRDRVRYDSPSIYGFILSASWGEDDFYDIGLRFKKEWNSIRIAAGIGYAVNEDEGNEIADLMGSVSVMHVPTGLFASFAAGTREDDDLDNIFEVSEDDATTWYVSAGVEKRFMSYGSTTLYGEYGNYVGYAQQSGGGLPGAEVDCGDANDFCSDLNMWGVGLVQNIDSAAMSVYAVYRNLELENTGGGASDLNDISYGVVGAKIKF